jgi:allantoin racemase
MKILIINPNSDLEMTESIQKTALEYAAGDFDVECRPTPDAPAFIETYEDQIKVAPGMIKLVRENVGLYDAFIVACHCDPNLDVIKEITVKPVVGIGEASMRIASMLGHSFSIITDTAHSIPNKEALVRKYYLQDVLASVRAPEEKITKGREEEVYFKVSKLAVEQDLAEVLVLGCAGMTALDKPLQRKLGVPVLDGIVCALMIATGLVKYGASISKARRYDPDYE